jgi:hypothetical protein
MMNAHEYTDVGAALFAHQRRLGSGHLLRLGEWPGELTVVDGRVWLTRPNDPADHVLSAGQRIRLGAGPGVLVEAWDREAGAVVRWTPWPRGYRLAAVRAGVLGRAAAMARRVAAGFDRLGRGFDAAAGSAASGASRAPGRVGCVEPVACAGTAR